MRKQTKLLIALVCVLVSLFAFAMVSSAQEYTVTTNDEFNTAFSSAVDGDTIIIKASISATHDFGKSITYILDGDGIVWTAGAQNTATGKTVRVLSRNGSNSFKPNTSMWCNSYGLTVKDLTSTRWILGSADATSTLLFDMDVVDGRLFYGTFLNEITLTTGVIATNLYSTNSSGDTNYFKCTTLNIYEGVKIYGNHSNKSLIDVTTLNMYGGEIYGNACIGMWAGVVATNLNMYGGSIHNNYQPAPHSVNTNANDPQSVAFVSAGNVCIYDGEIHTNYVGFGHKNETRGTAAGIGTRASTLHLYIKDGAIHSNVLVTLGQFGAFSIDENGCYTCVIDSANYENVIDNGDGTTTYTRQYLRYSLHAYEYSVIFKNASNSIINAFMVDSEGAVIKSVDGSETVAIPSGIASWSASANDCKAVEVVLNAQSTYYVSAEHTAVGENDCTKGVICDKCEAALTEPQAEHKLLVTIVYENNNFAKAGTRTETCQNSACEHNAVTEAPALFVFVGYSTNNDNTELCASYTTNVKAISEFKACNTDVKIQYGLVATANATSLDVLKLNGDKVEANVSNAVVADVTGEYAGFDFRLNGFTTPSTVDEIDTKAIELVICAYVVANDNINYLGSTNDLTYFGSTATTLTFYEISGEAPPTFE